MNTILERLLHWLAEADCTVILLSATLPESRRRALAVAYSGRKDIEYKRYPRITLVKPRHYPGESSESFPVCAEIPTEEPREVGLRFATTELPVLAGIIGRQLEHGGCAAIVCNTVDRAIDVYRHLKSSLQETECLLFHARTLRGWRREREEEILSKFGKGEECSGFWMNPNRPLRAVLVATQVIEQSLDLDFDFMVSEMAPMDLLLQRLGRLHRHRRRRPGGVETPELIVLCDGTACGPPPESFGKSIEFVYDRYILLRSWLAVRQRDKLTIPSDIEGLVEAVYGESNIPNEDEWASALNHAKEQMDCDQSESAKAARRLLVGRPKFPCDFIEEFNDQLADDEDPRVHQTVRAATREGDPSIMVVMPPLDTILASSPGPSEIRALLDRSVKLSHRGVYPTLLHMGKLPKEWTNTAHLQYARLLQLDELNRARIGDYVLTADEELGVLVEKDGANND
jgi:CRISPR-associated endonuclease/helicase Cas3